jgi:hypothetical protein
MSSEMLLSADPSERRERQVFGVDAVRRCKITGRIFETGSGALSPEAQTSNFVHEARLAADMPHESERCLQTGREYEVGSGCWPKSLQTARFLAELPADLKAQREADFEKLRDVETAGNA